MHILTTNAGGAYLRSPGENSVVAATMPSTVTRRGYRATHARSRRANVFVGRFNPGLAWYDNVGVLRGLGMSAPTAAPTAAVTGAGSIDGENIYYYSLVEKSGVYTLAESSDSPASATLSALDDDGVTVTVPSGAALAAIEPRATHVRIKRSVDGAPQATVADITIGTTTYVDTLAQGALGTTVPVFSDGAVIPEARNRPPLVRFALAAFKRVFYACSADNPQRLHRSLVNEPEAVPPGATHYDDTLDRDAITGLGWFRDHVLVGTYNNWYSYINHGDDDWVLHKIASGIGLLSHHSIAYDEFGRVWFAGQDGVYMYDGAFHLMSKDLLSYYVADYRANTALYEDSVGMIDKQHRVFKLLLPQYLEGPTTWYVGCIQGLDPARMISSSAPQPEWSFDVQDRAVSAQGPLVDSGSQEEYYHGGADGKLRLTNVEDDPDDDGDTRLKEMIVRTGHIWLNNDQSGDVHRGGKLTGVTIFFKCEHVSELSMWFGDDTAEEEAAAASWGPNSLAATNSVTRAHRTYRNIPILRGAAGGVTIEWRVESPLVAEYRGHSLNPRGGAKASPER
jgi:catechol 2,3-dioxygenase-like lactoylglutathione lyase family enzyme